MEAYLSVGMEILDLLNFTRMLYVFRPRKEWPQYYNLGLVDQLRAQGVGEGDNNQSAS